MENEKAPSAVQQEVARLAARMVDLFMPCSGDGMILGYAAILVLEKGKLKEQGSHEELLEKDGLYAEMWKDYQQAARWKVGKEESR